MKKKWMKFLIILLFAVLLWFLGVDRSWFVDFYPCGSFENILRYRILGIPIKTESKVFLNIKHEIATDLGVHCDHSDYSHWYKARWWGLLICAFPRHAGTIALVPDERWYDEQMQAKVRGMAKANPEIAEEFRKKVLLEKDSDYLEDFINKLRTPDKFNF